MKDRAQEEAIIRQMNGSSGSPTRDQRKNFSELLEHIDEVFQSSRQPLMPALSLPSAQWVLFYRDAAFGAAEEAHVGGAPARGGGPFGTNLFMASSYEDILGVLDQMGDARGGGRPTTPSAGTDPVAWYFNYLKSQLAKNKSP